MKLNAKKTYFVVLLFLLSIFVLWIRFPLKIETSLNSLMSMSNMENKIDDVLLNKYSSILNIVVESENFDLGKDEVNRISLELLHNGFDDKNVKYKLQNLSLDEVAGFFKKYNNLFLTVEDRKLIANSEYDKIKGNIESKLLYSWKPLLVDLEYDNFLLLNNYIESLFDGTVRWGEKGGFIWQEKNGKNYFLLSVNIRPDIDNMISDVSKVKKVVSKSW